MPQIVRSGQFSSNDERTAAFLNQTFECKDCTTVTRYLQSDIDDGVVRVHRQGTHIAMFQFHCPLCGRGGLFVPPSGTPFPPRPRSWWQRLIGID